jgi:Adenylate and Guanylate cyclase catalytic domain
MLLETIYSAFDELAETNNVFKVETVGDSYIAGKNRRIKEYFTSKTQYLL